MASTAVSGAPTTLLVPASTASDQKGSARQEMECIQCLFPIALTLRTGPLFGLGGDKNDIVGQWVRGSSESPVITFGGATCKGFDALIEAMRVERDALIDASLSAPLDSTGTGRPVRAARRRAVQRANPISLQTIVASVRLSTSQGSGNAQGTREKMDTSVQVPLSEFLCAVVARKGDANLYVSRSAGWVRRTKRSRAAAETEQTRATAAARSPMTGQPARQLSDMERIMRRIDRIMFEVDHIESNGQSSDADSDMERSDAESDSASASDNDKDMDDDDNVSMCEKNRDAVNVDEPMDEVSDEMGEKERSRLSRRRVSRTVDGTWYPNAPNRRRMDVHRGMKKVDVIVIPDATVAASAATRIVASPARDTPTTTTAPTAVTATVSTTAGRAVAVQRRVVKATRRTVPIRRTVTTVTGTDADKTLDSTQQTPRTPANGAAPRATRPRYAKRTRPLVSTSSKSESVTTVTAKTAGTRPSAAAKPTPSQRQTKSRVRTRDETQDATATTTKHARPAKKGRISIFASLAEPVGTDPASSSHDRRGAHGTGAIEWRFCIAPDDNGKSRTGAVEPTTGYFIQAECGICMRDDGRLLWNRARRSAATMQDLRDEPDISALFAPQQTRLADDALVANPCRLDTHLICVGCVRTMLLNTERPPVHFGRATVGCLSIDGETRCPRTDYPEAQCFAPLLERDELRHLALLYDRHRFVGMEIVPCPQNYVTEEWDRTQQRTQIVIKPCGAQCVVEHDRAVAAPRGHLPVMCTQNALCRALFCYHCRMRMPLQSTVCFRCTEVCGRDNPDALNHHFCHPALLAAQVSPPPREAPIPTVNWGQKPTPTVPATATTVAVDDKPRRAAATAQAAATLHRIRYGTPDSHLVTNREVTLDMALDQIERVLGAERVAQPCFRCGVPLIKSTQCNTLTHCGVQKCFMCGRNSVAGAHLEAHHWDPSGRAGCPRFDTNPYWQSINPPFVCVEGHCYSDTNECAVAGHRRGLDAMHHERRVWHVWAMLNSLPKGLAERLLARLVAATPTADAARRQLLERVARFSLASPPPL